MANKFLTSEQRQELLRELRLEDKAKYSDRIKTIILLDDGETYANIAKFLFLDEGTIANYRRRYKEGGLEELVTDDYSGRKSMLSVEESLALQMFLVENLFDNTKEICSYVFKKYHVEYTVSGMTALLHKLNFSFKKAKGVPGKAVKEKQEEFIGKLQSIRNENAPIFFADATHPTHQTELSYGWILKGSEKEILTSSGRKRINILGAVCLQTYDVLATFYEVINQESVCDFLCNLRKKSNTAEKIYFVLDRGPANTALTVKDVAQMLNIELVYLPSYSPNLNPIERLWKFFKKIVLRNKYFEKFDEFKDACFGFFKNIDQYNKELRSIINCNFRVVGT
jgi:transposase